MPMPFVSTVVANAADTDSIALAQTPAGAENLTLAATSFASGAAQLVTITSAANISNRTITLTGTDVYDKAISEAITGPNNATVTSTLAFKTVTQAAISGAAAGDLSIGNSATAEGQMYVPDVHSNPFLVGIGCDITSGSPTFSVQYTFDNTLAVTGPPGVTAYTYSSSANTWYDFSALAAKTADTAALLDVPVYGIRLRLTVAGTVRMKVIQTGGGYR